MSRLRPNEMAFILEPDKLENAIQNKKIGNCEKLKHCKFHKIRVNFTVKTGVLNEHSVPIATV